MRVISLSQVRWFSSRSWVNSCEDSVFSNELIVEFRIDRVRRFRVDVDGFTLEDRCVSLWVVEVVDHVGLITCRRGCIGHWASLFILWIFAVFVDRQRSLRCRWSWGIGRQRLNAHVQARGWRWVRRCKHGWHGDDLVFTRTTQTWKSWVMQVVMNCACTETTQGKWTTTNSVWSDVHTIRRIGARTNMSLSSGRTDISFSLETEQGNWKQHSFFVFSHTLGTSNSDSNTVRSPDVSGQWSREFQPLCLPHLDSHPTRSHTCLDIRTEQVNNRGDGDLQSLWPASSEKVLANQLLLHCGHCLWDWTFFTWLAQAAD